MSPLISFTANKEVKNDKRKNWGWEISKFCSIFFFFLLTLEVAEN